MNPRVASERFSRLLRPICTARHPLSCTAAVSRRTTALLTRVQPAEVCARSKAGRIRPLSTTATSPPGDKPLSFRKGDFTEYDDMNKVILSVGNARDAEGLLNIVRRNSGDGEPESLDFHHTNCCIWLNKWAEMDQQWLWGRPPPEVLQVVGRSVLMLQKRRLAFVPREVSTLGMAMCALHYKWEPSDRSPQQQILDAVTAWCLKEGLNEFNTLDLGCLMTAFLKLNYHPGAALLDMLAQACTPALLEEFSPVYMVTMLHMFAALQHHPGTPLLDAIANECIRRQWQDMRIQFIGPTFLAFVAWRYMPPRAWLDGSATQVLHSPDEDMTPAQVAAVVSAFNFYNHYPGRPLLRKLAKVCEQNLEGFSPVRLAYFVRAFKKFRESPGNRLLTALLERVRVSGVENLTLVHMVTLLTSCSVFKHYLGLKILDDMAASLATRPLDVGRLDRLAVGLNVYQHFRHHPGEELLDSIAQQSLSLNFKGWEPDDLAKLLHTMASFTHHPGDAFVQKAINVIREGGWDKLSLRTGRIVVWSLVVLDIRVPAALLIALEPKVMAAKDLLADLRGGPNQPRPQEGQDGGEEQEWGKGAANESAKIKELAEDVRLLRSALYVMPKCSRSFDRPRKALGKALNTVRNLIPEATKVWEPTEMHGELKTAVRRRNRHLREGAWVGGDRIALDVMIDLQKGRHVGVKIHGPTSYCINRPLAPLGQTVLEWRVLNKAREQGDLSSWISTRSVTPEALAQVGVAVRAVLQRTKAKSQEEKEEEQAEKVGHPTET